MQNYIYIERAEACLQRVLYICNSIVRSTTPSRQARWHCELTTWWALRIKIILEEHPRLQRDNRRQQIRRTRRRKHERQMERIFWKYKSHPHRDRYGKRTIYYGACQTESGYQLSRYREIFQRSSARHRETRTGRRHDQSLFYKNGCRIYRECLCRE